MEDISILELVRTAWPLGLGFITLVIILAKMHSQIATLQEKVRVLFELHNNDVRRD
jgi:hypothetical protein|tara:strand:+ start:262 stop:429 length:168 start_codon:yes stop_codon:yes gene_type:complete